MTLSINRGFFVALLVTVFLPTFSSMAAPAPAVAKAECPVCGMHFSEKAKTSYFGTHDGKPLHLCSFACAAKLSDRDPKSAFSAVDYPTGNKIPAESAYFLVNSKKVLKELEFDMPPSVVAFADEKAAKEKVKALGDGEVVKGWPQLKKTLVP